MARELKRLNTNMPVELVARIDEYAERMNVNRTAAINMLVSMALEQRKSIMDELLKKISEMEKRAKAHK